jgi:hypothetical protein
MKPSEIEKQINSNGKYMKRENELFVALEEIGNKKGMEYRSEKNYRIGDFLYLEDVGLGEVIERISDTKCRADFGNYKRDRHLLEDHILGLNINYFEGPQSTVMRENMWESRYPSHE